MRDTADHLTGFGSPLGGGSFWVYVVFSSDGRALRLIDETGRVSSWPVSHDALVNQACTGLNSDLTSNKWRDLLNGVMYRPACPSP
jgi:hypothetical protein